jgi:hypothetical protein
METNKTPASSSHGFRRFFRRLLLFFLLILIAIFCFLNWGVYDEGIRAGVVVRISKKGVIFKTYEGQLNLQSFGALKGTTPLVQTFDFSVEKNRKDIVRELETVALTGERVSLHYMKRYAIFPWKGNTKYFITEVEREGERPFEEK